MALRVLVEDDYFVLSLDDASRMLRLVRTARAFPSLEALHASARGVSAETARRPGAALLIDAREAPARNDPEFEREFALARRRMMASCARVAILVRSALGRLQVNRYVREDGASTQTVFSEEREALAYLKSP